MSDLPFTSANWWLQHDPIAPIQNKGGRTELLANMVLRHT